MIFILEANCSNNFVGFSWLLLHQNKFDNIRKSLFPEKFETFFFYIVSGSINSISNNFKKNNAFSCFKWASVHHVLKKGKACKTVQVHAPQAASKTHDISTDP